MWRVLNNWVITEVTSFRRGPATWDSPGGTFLLDDEVIVSSKRMFAKLADAVAYADRNCDDDVDECRSIVKQYSDRLRLLKRNREANHALLARTQADRDEARDRVDGDAVQAGAAAPASLPVEWHMPRTYRIVNYPITARIREIWAPWMDANLPDSVPANEAEAVAGGQGIS
jgi:hypothetical protein